MKKILITALMLSLMLPASLFAATPSDEEVYEATVAVLSVFSLVFMSSMFGGAPENATVDMDMETGKTSMVFEDFPVEDFMDSMSEMMQSNDEEITFSFTSMDGDILINEAGDLNLDMDLEGGNVKTLEMVSQGEDIVSIKANGKSYDHLKDMLMEMGEEE